MTRSHQVFLAIPTASVENCRRNLPAWRKQGYLIALLRDRATSNERDEILADKVCWVDKYEGWAASVNHLCRTVIPAECDLVVTGGDDMLPDPRHTAAEIAEQFVERFPDSGGIMQPQGDTFLNAQNYCGSPWIGRRWWESMYGGAGALCAAYRHNWADNELYWLARCSGKLWERTDLSQPHEHFSRRGEAPPEYWKRNVSGADQADVQTFLARAWLGFPGHEAVGSAIKFDRARFQREYPRTAESYWISRYGGAAGADEGTQRIADVLKMCARENLKRVAIFGAGTHTRMSGSALMEPPVEIVCIIDDNPALAGGRLWNYPIVTLEQAMKRQFDAVVLSSKSGEAQLLVASAPLAAKSIRVLSLYTQVQHAA